MTGHPRVEATQPSWADGADGRLLHELVEAQADRTPDRTALSDGDHELTYAEVDAAANRLARALAERGVRTETPVAIVAERSVAAIVAILGVLKAGGTYVPVDPDYPPPRVRQLLTTTAVRLLVTTADVLPRLPDGVAEVFLLDEERSRTATQTAARVTRNAHPDGLAYVIHTSGSTGVPKGVMISHRGVVNATVSRRDLYRDDPGRYLLLSSLAFDSSVAGIFWTLACGGCLLVPGSSIQRDPHELTGFIARHRPTHLLCVPSLYRVILQAAPAGLASLRLCVLAGEEWPPDLHQRHRQVLPGARLGNEYGATEVSVFSTGFVCPDGPMAAEELSVGDPIAGATLHLLDGELNPVPPDGEGEAYLGGIGVARGYAGQPAVTAERFVPDPYAERPGERMYRTGDLLRRIPGGGARFLSRLDDQTKIRGYRVELGEIRARLTGYPEVGDAAVVVWRAATPGARLVAYVVLAGTAVPTGSAVPTGTAVPDGPAAADGVEALLADLSRRLADELPSHMVPRMILAIPAIPLTPNGKLDREALPEPGPGDRPPRPAAPPSGPVAEVVAEVLQVADVGPDDNFFALGGDSLQAMEVAARLRRRGVVVSAGQVLAAPTVAALAELAALAALAEPLEPPRPSEQPELSAATIDRILNRIR